MKKPIKLYHKPMCGGGKEPRKPKKKQETTYLKILEIFLNQKNIITKQQELVIFIVTTNYIKYANHSDRSKKISIKEYLDKTKPYFKGCINNLRKPDTWKIQLTLAIQKFEEYKSLKKPR